MELIRAMYTMHTCGTLILSLAGHKNSPALDGTAQKVVLKNSTFCLGSPC